MSSARRIVDELAAAASGGESVVLASVVRVVGSSYGGVGSRMLVRDGGATAGLVSGGCLESEIVARARAVRESGRAALVSWDARSDDDLVWGMGLGCNGLIEVLLEPLGATEALATAALLRAAIEGEAPSVLATVVGREGDASPPLGARALFTPDGARAVGAWGHGLALELLRAAPPRVGEIGRGGELRELRAPSGVTVVALEAIRPVVRLVVCGSGPDAAPVARLGAQLGWDVTVVDHRPVSHAPVERFPDARVVECRDPLSLGESVRLDARTAAVVMSHHFLRDAEYVAALAASEVRYLGVLGPSARTQRMLAELASRRLALPSRDVLHGPIGLDVGGEGPEAIALAIVAEVSAVMHGRSGGMLRDRRAPLHDAPRASESPAARA